jgi:hypothetical protein
MQDIVVVNGINILCILVAHYDRICQLSLLHTNGAWDLFCLSKS